MTSVFANGHVTISTKLRGNQFLETSRRLSTFSWAIMSAISSTISHKLVCSAA